MPGWAPSASRTSATLLRGCGQQAARQAAKLSRGRRLLQWGCVAAKTGGDTCERPKVTFGRARAPRTRDLGAQARGARRRFPPAATGRCRSRLGDLSAGFPGPPDTCFRRGKGSVVAATFPRCPNFGARVQRLLLLGGARLEVRVPSRGRRGAERRGKPALRDGERRLLVRQVQGWVGGAPGSRPRPQVLCREPGLLPSPPLRLNRLGAGPFILHARLCHKLGPRGPDSEFSKSRGELLVERSGLGEGSKQRNAPRTLAAAEVRPPLGSGPSNLTLDWLKLSLLIARNKIMQPFTAAPPKLVGT